MPFIFTVQLGTLNFHSQTAVPLSSKRLRFSPLLQLLLYNYKSPGDQQPVTSPTSLYLPSAPVRLTQHIKSIHHCPLKNKGKGNCRFTKGGTAKIKYCKVHQTFCGTPGCKNKHAFIKESDDCVVCHWIHEDNVKGQKELDRQAAVAAAENK
jgi:hypothetical protein